MGDFDAVCEATAWGGTDSSDQGQKAHLRDMSIISSASTISGDIEDSTVLPRSHHTLLQIQRHGRVVIAGHDAVTTTEATSSAPHAANSTCAEEYNHKHLPIKKAAQA